MECGLVVEQDPLRFDAHWSRDWSRCSAENLISEGDGRRLANPHELQTPLQYRRISWLDAVHPIPMLHWCKHTVSTSGCAW